MKRVLFMLSMAVFAVFVSSCGSGDVVNKNATPTEVTEAVWGLIQNGDYAKAVAMTVHGQSLSEEEQSQLAQLAEAMYSSVGGLKTAEVLEEKIAEDGQTATVKMKVTYGDGSSQTIDQSLVMTENGWCMKD